ncbi:reverse transcriptase/maturase family protein [Trebonia sp.]|uniref:reverse transcriptase/maturase family protein n=1 Tax=Trebonia sp. TaxID=2767075 RepID=UPI00262EF5C7|nr:reverse transcriptase/maturase family protein [Trebonia sp.]
MQEAAVVLSVLRDRGRKGLPLMQLYRQMFNKDLYLLAYGNIYSNQGAMTPGASAETADGMSEGKIDQIIELMRHERYRFSPARRIYIPKKNGKLRPLGLPSWSDKLVGEVVRLLLEAIYEPQFSGRSHGFRKGRGCHTALREVRDTWPGTVWFIEGDISDCFGSLDHQILLKILAEKIGDQRFLRLIRHMLQAGYLEDWEYHDTLSGTPQGGVVSPILSNIYLDKLDRFVEQELIPQYTRGASRARNPAYRKTAKRLAMARRHGDRAAARDLTQQLRALPVGDPADPGFRRLRYLRYADDHLLGLAGPRAEAEQIKGRLAAFLRETLGLELSQHKTLITHARTTPARFLGYDITVQHRNTRITYGRRSANGAIALRVPPDVIKAQCARYRYHGKPWHRPRLQNLPDYDIVRVYGAEYRGVVNYYRLAQDAGRLQRLRWYAETSMLKTLAAKHKSTVTKMAARYKTTVITSDGPRTCFEARLTREGRKDLVARFGGIILRQDRRAVIRDPAPVPVITPRKELIHRLRAHWCELCERGATVAIHQVAALSHLGKPEPGQPAWAALMAKMRRKTLVVCAPCHAYIHANPVANAA